MTASSARGARNPDGVGDGMGRNVSGDPAGYFHDTQKTLKDRSGLTDTPDWLTDLIAHTTQYAADIAYGNPAADYLTDGHREWTRAQDQAHPDRPCAWCLHPRNSPECNFAEGHTPYMETFGGAG